MKADRRRPQSDATIQTARATVAQFIDARATDIAAATACMAGGKEVFRGACAGLVMRNASDNRCLDMLGATSADGAVTSSFDCHGKANQRVFVKAVAGGDVEVHITLSDKCLDVPGLKLDDNLQLMQFTCNGGPNQRFTMKQVSGGVQLIAKHSSKCVALGPHPQNGVPVVQTTCSADRNQVWSLHASMFD